MKKWLIFIVLISSNTLFWSQNLEEVRTQYSQVIGNKELCENLMTELEKNKEASVLHLGYLGSLQTIWANHTFNPMNKLKTFNKGKQNIEKAIQKDPHNVELRFIRLSIQKNIPSFLGYKNNIETDKTFILKNMKSVESKVLHKNIQSLLNQ